MAQCIACSAEVAVYNHSCPKCGGDVRRASVRSSTERRQARLCHLLALPGMFIFMVSFPALGAFALAPLNLILPLIYRWSHRESPSIRTHTTEVVNFQALWTVTVTILWLLVIFASPPNSAPWWQATASYIPDQPIVTEFTGIGPETISEQADGDAEDERSYWPLATMAFGLLSVTWLGGIALSVFLAYDLGNGGSGRYPLRIPLLRSE